MAFVLTTAERARDFRTRPVSVLGAGKAYTREHSFCAEPLTTTGARISAERAYRVAGLRPADMDVAGIYGCFAGTVVTMRGDLGFRATGEGGPFVAAGEITFSTAYRPPSAEFKDDVPYPVVLAELSEGPRMLSPLVDAPPETVRIGQPVQIVHDRVTEAIPRPRFRPLASGATTP